MSCQKVLSMLSAYIDGEVQESDAASIKQHLAECTSCAQEMNVLLSMTSLLQANAEVDTPEFLLERIEAATVMQPSLSERLRSIFGCVPQYAKWGSAGLAAAALALFMLLSPGQNPSRVGSPVAVKPAPPTVKVTMSTAKSSTAPAKHGQPLMAVQLAHKRYVKRGHPTLARNAGGVRVAAGPAAQPGTTAEKKRINAVSTAASDSIENEITPEVMIDEPITTAEAVPETGAQVANTDVATVGAVHRQVMVKEDPSALEQLKAKLATSRRKRDFQTDVPRIEGSKHSVKLVGLQF